MKYTLAIAALLGLASIDEVNAVRMNKANPAVEENVKKLDFPGSKQGMQYARTEEPVVIPPKLAKCPDGRICHQYDSKVIHYEEPFNGISAHEFKIGHQNTQTQPKYVPTSIYPTNGKKTGFAQNGDTHIHFAQTPTVPPNLPQYQNGPAVVENVKKLDFPGSK